jgi:hypothetical protein
MSGNVVAVPRSIPVVRFRPKSATNYRGLALVDAKVAPTCTRSDIPFVARPLHLAHAPIDAKLGPCHEAGCIA